MQKQDVEAQPAAAISIDYMASYMASFWHEIPRPSRAFLNNSRGGFQTRAAKTAAS